MNDAENFVSIQKQILTLNQQSEAIKANRENLTSVTSVFKTDNKKPQSKVGFLTRYLNEHDCIKLTGIEKDSCYKETVVLLILITKLSEEKEYEQYLLNNSLGQIKHNLEFVIDSYPTFNY